MSVFLNVYLNQLNWTKARAMGGTTGTDAPTCAVALWSVTIVLLVVWRLGVAPR